MGESSLDPVAPPVPADAAEDVRAASPGAINPDNKTIIPPAPIARPDLNTEETSHMARKVDVEAALAEFGIPPNAASDNVVLFPASKKSATDAELTRFELFARNGFGPLLLPPGPPGWMVAPEFTIKADDVAKVPMYLGGDGLARGYGGWTTRTPATEQDIQRWQRMGCLDRPANVSLRTGEVAGASLACGATDID